MQGRLPTVVEREREAVDWLEGRPDAPPATLTTSRLRLARALEQLGSYDDAEARLRQAEVSARREGDPGILADTLNRFGILRGKRFESFGRGL